MAVPEVDVVGGLSCRAVVQSLGAGPAPEQVIAKLAAAKHLAVLSGDWAGGGTVVASEPVTVLHAAADPYAAIAVQPKLPEDVPDEFFGGGWIGWFGYAAPPFLAFYDHVLRHRDGQWWFEALWSEERDAVLTARLAASSALLAAGAAAVDSVPWRVGRFAGASMPAHLDAVERGVELIRAGEVYQVNVCTRLGADFDGEPARLFAHAARQLAPRFGAYVAGDERSVACLSPELFLRRRGRVITTSPIKGTAPRHDDVDSTALRRSAKDIAENVMIVDLMRNDLGRVCEVGSVHPAALLDIEPHPGVWHLVSTVTGLLRGDVDDADLLRATFPPGSVTGAPKVRAVDAIAHLERVPRGVYTGAVGFAAPTWGLEFAVAIRTFEIERDRIELGVGGGVTADSVPMLEWRECLAKAAPLLAAIGAQCAADVITPEVDPSAAQYAGGLLESVLVLDGYPVRLADHLARLDRSSRELYGNGLPSAIAARARAACVDHTRAALRVVVAPDGAVTISCTELPKLRPETQLRVQVRPAGLWRHKWADRSILALSERAPGAPLFVADDGAVLETSRGNVFLICPDGSLRTPPLRDDLLPGITRRAVLDAARDTGRTSRLGTFTVDELQHHAAFWTSSLSGIVGIDSVDGVPLPRREEDIASLRAELHASALRRAAHAGNQGGDSSVR